MGIFIAIEGIDGSGKTTQARMLAEWLQTIGKKVILTKEPSSSFWGRFARFLSGYTSSDILQRLFAMDRTSHLKNVVSPALHDGYVVICDRYVLSAIAYSRDERKAKLRNARFPAPNLTIVLDVPVEASQKQLKRKKSAFEKTGVLERARKKYLASKAFIIDAKYGPEIVFGKVRARVERLF